MGYAEQEAAMPRLVAENEALKSLLRDWLKAYDASGPDNGPSLTEHDCAERARKLLATP